MDIEKIKLMREEYLLKNFYDNFHEDFRHFDVEDFSTFLLCNSTVNLVQYCCAGNAQKIDDTWQLTEEHQLLLGEKFYDAILKSFEAIVEEGMISTWNTSINIMNYINGKHTRKILNHNNGNPNNIWDYSWFIPYIVKNIALSSNIDERKFVDLVLGYYKNGFTASTDFKFKLLYFAPFFANVYGDFLTPDDVKLLEQYVQNYSHYHVYTPKLLNYEGRDMKWREHLIDMVDTAAQIHYTFAKYVPGADIKLQEKMILDYASGNYAYKLALAFPDSVDLVPIMDCLTACKMWYLKQDLLDKLDRMTKEPKEKQNPQKTNLKKSSISFTDEELKIIALLSEGKSVNEIASILNMSTNSVNEVNEKIRKRIK